MRVALLADAYPPMRTSAAIQLRDLASEFARQNFDVTVIVPAPDAVAPWKMGVEDGVKVIRVASMRTKDVGRIRRGIGEVLFPALLTFRIRNSPLASTMWDAVVWYSPTIFLGPVVAYLRHKTGCRTYLILRDIFPEWAVDVGVLRRGLAYRFFKRVEKFQYRVADTIGVQSESNRGYVERSLLPFAARIEVLQNWLSPAVDRGSSIALNEGQLAGRTIFVYAGNMGVAQDVDIVLDLAELLDAEREDIGFLLVGRGTDLPRLQAIAKERALDNVVFYDEIDSSEIPGLLAQCHVGLVTLDPRHTTHNVPGKFLAYLQAGLPVLASVNAGNDLVELIHSREVGFVCAKRSADEMRRFAEVLCADSVGRKRMSRKAKQLFKSMFSTTNAVRQIASAIAKREAPAAGQ